FPHCFGCATRPSVQVIVGRRKRSTRRRRRVSHLPTISVFVWAEAVLPLRRPLVPTVPSVPSLGEDGGRGKGGGGSSQNLRRRRHPFPGSFLSFSSEASGFGFLFSAVAIAYAANPEEGQQQLGGVCVLYVLGPSERERRGLRQGRGGAHLPVGGLCLLLFDPAKPRPSAKMASFCGNLHRPLSAVAAVAVAAVSSDLSDKFTLPKSDSVQAPPKTTPCDAGKVSGSWVSRVSFSNISAWASARNSVDEIKHPSSNSGVLLKPDTLFSSFSSKFVSSPAFLDLHRHAKLGRTPQSVDIALPTLSSEDVMYRWHLPKMSSFDVGKPDCSAIRSRTVVVLLGWLGAKQKHLKRYADWYTSRGFHVVTFTLPLADILSYNVGGKAEENVVSLANHLSDWVSEEQGKNLIFHTFSNTGWITYGVILENFKKQDPTLMEKIKGCIVDSAPVAAPDPQVWASGFSAAFLKKRSVATKGMLKMYDSSVDAFLDRANEEPKPAVAETALLTLLEKFFEVVLNLPSVNRRLTDVLDMLSSNQPKCPQLYVYSSSDRVIPAKSVESFVEHQRKAGHEVKAYDFVSSPHVDHFRSHPSIYTSQLTSFLDDHVFTCCKDSS
ncbi:hypothetical protein Taro_026434, partial [Colocasia esculenta]|nr:hypothetical protein [Colocasia esculenta]